MAAGVSNSVAFGRCRTVTSVLSFQRALIHLVRRLGIGGRSLDSPRLVTTDDSIKEERERLVRRMLRSLLQRCGSRPIRHRHRRD